MKGARLAGWSTPPETRTATTAVTDANSLVRLYCTQAWFKTIDFFQKSIQRLCFTIGYVDFTIVLLTGIRIPDCTQLEWCPRHISGYLIARAAKYDVVLLLFSLIHTTITQAICRNVATLYIYSFVVWLGLMSGCHTFKVTLFDFHLTFRYQWFRQSC